MKVFNYIEAMKNAYKVYYLKIPDWLSLPPHPDALLKLAQPLSLAPCFSLPSFRIFPTQHTPVVLLFHSVHKLAAKRADLRCRVFDEFRPLHMKRRLVHHPWGLPQKREAQGYIRWSASAGA
jgi:hypothetical protein